MRAMGVLARLTGRRAASVFPAAFPHEFVRGFGSKLFVNPPRGAHYLQSDPRGLERTLRKPSRTLQSLVFLRSLC